GSWSSTSLAKKAVLAHRPGQLCLDKAFALIEGQPKWVQSILDAASLLQLLLNRRDHFRRIRRDRGFKALHHVSVAIHQKLGEVPLDVTRDARSGLFGQVGVERRLIGALDGNLRVHGKAHAVLAAAEGLDL